jgi:hypothetical protein
MKNPLVKNFKTWKLSNKKEISTLKWKNFNKHLIFTKKSLSMQITHFLKMKNSRSKCNNFYNRHIAI